VRNKRIDQLKLSGNAHLELLAANNIYRMLRLVAGLWKLVQVRSMA